MSNALHRRLFLSWSVILLGLVGTGCSLIATASWIINPTDTPAAFAGLKGKKVAVVCRASSTSFSDPTVNRDIATVVNEYLTLNGDKITVIDEQIISDWSDRHRWNDFKEIGKAVKADMVVGIDVEQFRVSQGTTLLQGHANVRVTVYDMAEGGKKVYSSTPPEVVFPTNGPIPSAERSEHEFRNQFVRIIAGQLARNFYAYDSREFHAMDGQALHN